MTTNTPELTGASDKSFKFDLQLKNDTAQDVTVSANATGLTGWDIETTLTGATDAASTVVETGATQSISVNVTRPRARRPTRTRSRSRDRRRADRPAGPRSSSRARTT